MEPRVVLIGKPGCHLCEEARTVVAGVCEDLGVPWQERSIIGDPALAGRYSDLIPVVLVDGQEHAAWRVDPTALRSALAR